MILLIITLAYSDTNDVGGSKWVNKDKTVGRKMKT